MMFNRSVMIPVLAAALASTGCGDDGGTAAADAAPISVFDAAPEPPDATPPPDAFVCQETECGELCVDIASDPAHCGGCDMACEQSGMVCNDMECECPPAFVGSTVSSGFSQIQSMGGATVAFIPYQSGGVLNMGLLAWDGTIETGVAYDLSTVSGLAPAFAALYDFDAQDPQGSLATSPAVLAIQGTLTFEYVCDTAAKAVGENLVMVPFDINTMTADPDGCSFPVESVTVTGGMGTCEPPGS